MTTVKSSPHIHGPLRTDKAMLMVVIALLPSALWGVYAFGFKALFTLVVAIASALLTEYLLGKVSHEFTLRDGSALVTGLLVGMNMPPLAYHQFYIPLIASAFAITVVKWTFGGLGCNWMNPALAGRVFVFFSFTSQMSTFTPVRWMQLDAVSSATPLSALKTAAASGAVGTSSELLSAAGLPVSDIAASLASSTGLSPYAIDAFLGNVGGCIGEVSALLLLVGGIFLIAAKIIPSPVPYADVVTSSTHKTWRGARGGSVILCREELAKRIDRAVFPGLQGAPKMDMIAARGAQALESMSVEFRAYAQAVYDNAQVLAETLASEGLRLVTGGTNTHLILVDVRNLIDTGKAAERVLESVGIVVNKNGIPFDPQPNSLNSGIRIGTPALTTRGFGADEIRRVGELLAHTLRNADNEAILDEVRNEVRELADAHPLFDEKWLPTTLCPEFAEFATIR